jgi:hypothetical protein
VTALAFPPTRLARFVYGTLTGDATVAALVGTRVYAGIAPEGTALPYVTFLIVDCPDVAGVGLARIMAQARVQIDLWGRGSALDLEPLADAVDRALQGATGTDVLAFTRLSTLARVEVVEGVTYQHQMLEYLALLN